MSDFIFFYQSLFLYSFCLADVVHRFKAVSCKSTFCGVCEFAFLQMKSSADGHSDFEKVQIDVHCVFVLCALSFFEWISVALKRLFHHFTCVFDCHPVWT